MNDRPKRPSYTPEEVEAKRAQLKALMGKLDQTLDKLGTASAETRSKLEEMVQASTAQNAWLAQLMQAPTDTPDPAMAAQQGKLLGLLERLISLQLRSKPMVAAAYLDRAVPQALHYHIVLKEDSDENRAAVAKMLEGYAQTQMGALAPAEMAFVSADAAAAMPDLEAVDLG
jgi:hypothetical protein